MQTLMGGVCSVINRNKCLTTRSKDAIVFIAGVVQTSPLDIPTCTLRKAQRRMGRAMGLSATRDACYSFAQFVLRPTCHFPIVLSVAATMVCIGKICMRAVGSQLHEASPPGHLVVCP